MDETRRGAAIKPDIIERVERKPPQKNAACSGRYACDRADEPDRVAYVQLWLCGCHAIGVAKSVPPALYQGHRLSLRSVALVQRQGMLAPAGFAPTAAHSQQLAVRQCAGRWAEQSKE